MTVGEEKIEQYGLGWVAGASFFTPIIPKARYPKEYLRGQADGALAWRSAIDEARKRLGVKLTSVAF